jgi:hypothetical protein
MPGKISNRLMKPEFGNRCCHHGYRLESLNLFPSQCQREIETYPMELSNTFGRNLSWTMGPGLGRSLLSIPR